MTQYSHALQAQLHSTVKHHVRLCNSFVILNEAGTKLHLPGPTLKKEEMPVRPAGVPPPPPPSRGPSCGRPSSPAPVAAAVGVRKFALC